MIIGYARVSSEEQKREALSLDAQAKRLAAHASEGMVFEEVTSASKTPLRKRKVFLECIELLRQQPKKSERTLLVTRFDRLSRSSEDLKLMRDLMAEGINLHTLDSGNAEAGAMGGFSLAVQIAMAQYEADLLSEKAKHVYEERRKSGHPMNRTPFGFRLASEIKDGALFKQLEIDPVQGPQAVQIFESVIRNQGNVKATLRECQFDGMPRSPRGLVLWLGNLVHCGHLVYFENELDAEGEDIRHNTHEPLVSDAMFLEVQALLNARKVKKVSDGSRKIPPHPLGHLLHCPVCGRRATFSAKRRACKGGSIGRYAGKREPGEIITSYTAECRYTQEGRCEGWPDGEKPLSKASVESALEVTINTLVSRSEELSNSQVMDAEAAESDPDELELLQNIKETQRQLATANQEVVKSLLQSTLQQLEKALDQHRAKQEGESVSLSLRMGELRQLDLTARAFKELDNERLNTVLRQFVVKVTPACGSDPVKVELCV